MFWNGFLALGAPLSLVPCLLWVQAKHLLSPVHPFMCARGSLWVQKLSNIASLA